MKEALFEEREYESALYQQLTQGGDQWPPGTVLEQYLGFDLGAFLRREYLWQLHQITAPSGISVFHDLWPILRHRPFNQERLPSGLFNCFIQAKRGSLRRRLPVKAKGLGLTTPCYYFETDPDQQACLSHAAAAFPGRALFVYAAPVFHTSTDYHRHRTLGDIAEHSTFPLASDLDGHGAWYYCQPGAVGVRNPDFSFFESVPLSAHVARLRSSAQQGERGNVSENFRQLATQLFGLVREVADLANSPRAAAFAEEWRRLERVGQISGGPKEAISYLQISAFARAYNLTWTVVNDAQE